MSGSWTPPPWNAADPAKPQRSDLAGWADYGYCASHCRWFWGLRLHLVCTLRGLPVVFALTDPKADEREVLLGIFDDTSLVEGRAGQTLIGDKGYYGRTSRPPWPPPASNCSAPPARRARPCRIQHFKPLRQVIESINHTFKGQLDLERHGGHTVDGVTVRVLQRILALTAAIWHNQNTGQPSCAHWSPTTTDPLE